MFPILRKQNTQIGKDKKKDQSSFSTLDSGYIVCYGEVHQSYTMLRGEKAEPFMGHDQQKTDSTRTLF